MSSSLLRNILIWISGGALLIAMVVDTLAMLGRAFQFPLIGSIEIVQAVVLFAASGALIVTTLDHAHARVGLLLNRLSTPWRNRFERFFWFAAAVLFAALLTGSVWIGADVWAGHEESEILRIPYRPLRIAVVLALSALLVLALLRIKVREKR